MGLMLRRRKLRVTGAIVLTLAAALGAWFFLSGDTSPGRDISAAEPVVSTDELDGFSNEELLEAGLRLTALDAGVQPDVSQGGGTCWQSESHQRRYDPTERA